MNDDFNLGRSIAIWTAIAIVAQAAMVWALGHEGVAAGIAFNIGWIGQFVVCVGLFRKAPIRARLWPIVITVGLFALWATVRWARGDEDAIALVLVPFGVLGFFVAFMASWVWPTRRGWITDSPLRRKLELAVVMVLTMSQVMGVPTGVWRARMTLLAFIAFAAIALWPAPKPPAAEDGPVEPVSGTL